MGVVELGRVHLSARAQGLQGRQLRVLRGNDWQAADRTYVHGYRPESTLELGVHAVHTKAGLGPRHVV